jgi:L-ascorbate metabolism protein UlaG (beta-lactamase superfamily)
MNLKGIKLTWLGHSTFRIETPAGKTVFIDPWIMGNPMCPEAHKKVKKADVLLCTHGHGDHIGDAVEIVKQHNPLVVGIYELCLWLSKKGAKQISPMNKGGTQTVGDIKVTMVHADHSCGIQDGDEIVIWRRGMWLRYGVREWGEDLPRWRHQRFRRHGDYPRAVRA